mgnify:CR=1 FL=1
MWLKLKVKVIELEKAHVQIAEIQEWLSNAEEQRRADNYDHWTGGSVEKYREGYDRKAIRNEQEKLLNRLEKKMIDCLHHSLSICKLYIWMCTFKCPSILWFASNWLNI